MTSIIEASLGYSIIVLLGVLILCSLLFFRLKNRKAQFAVSTLTLALIAVLSAALFFMGSNFEVIGTFSMYQFSVFFASLFSVALILVNVLAYSTAKDYLNFSILLAFAASGMFFVALSNSIVTILLGLELMSLPTAFMILSVGKPGIEAALKLFVLAAISIAVFAFALSLVFPYNPQLTLAHIVPSQNIDGNYLTLLALVLFIAALSFEAGLFPFNAWIPDVYQGAPSYATGLLSGVNKKVAFVGLTLAVFIIMMPLIQTSSLIFQVLAILTMFFGNLMALLQDNVKRMFAYSSISQAGYIAIGFAAASQYGLSASIFQIVAHMFAIIGTFAIIGWYEEKNIKSIKEFSGASRRNPITALALTIFMLSFIGIPPLAGFTGKFLLFTSAINQGLLVLVVIAILNSLISVYYYARVIMSMYAERDVEHASMQWGIMAVVLVCLAIIIIVGIYPQPLITATSAASSSIFNYISPGISK